jgi:DNA repair exonuclease SbcCD nuclease subunit
MKFAFIADIHLSRYGSDKIEDETNLPERLHSIKKVLYEIANYCISNNIFTIIIGGDTLHGKSVIYAIAQEIMIQYFKDFAHLITFIVIDGNHDLSGKSDNVVSALRSLENIPNVDWVPYNTTSFMEKENMILVPYSTKLPEIIKDHKANILVSHFGLSEGILNSGMSIVSEISMKDLIGRYKLVLLGHYHKPQEIIRQDISLYYCGSPIQLDWGEKNDIKRFLVVDTDTLDVQSIPINEYKKHIEFEIKSGNIDEILAAAKKARENGDHVKVIMREKVDLTDFKGEFNVVDKTEADITDRGITSSMSQEDKILKYIEIKEIPEDQSELYAKEAFDIMQSCEV